MTRLACRSAGVMALAMVAACHPALYVVNGTAQYRIDVPHGVADVEPFAQDVSLCVDGDPPNRMIVVIGRCTLEDNHSAHCELPTKDGLLHVDAASIVATLHQRFSHKSIIPVSIERSGPLDVTISGHTGDLRNIEYHFSGNAFTPGEDSTCKQLLQQPAPRP